MEKRGQHGERGVARVGDMVRKIRAGARRLAFRQTGQILQDGQRSDRKPETQLFMLRASGSLQRHRYIDEVRPDLPDGIITQSELLHDAGREIVGNDVAASDEPTREFLTSGIIEIDGDAALAAVSVGKVAAAIDARLPVAERPAAPQSIQPLGALDLDDLRAEIGQQLGRECACSDPREIGNPHAFKREFFQLTIPRLRRLA
jgi:hypothetical protein